MLLRIAALLVAFSLLAERAAGRSFPVRFLVLAILRRAEAVARALVAMETGADGPCLEEPLAFSYRVVDAASLALRFRPLAAILVDVVDAACRSAGRHPIADGAPDGLAPILVLILPGRRRYRVNGNLPLDTS